MAKSKSKSGNKAAVGFGAGLALAAVAAAGAYFLYGTKEGAKKRKQVKGWMLQAKGEVLDKMEDLKDVNEKTYGEIVDKVADKYKKIKKVDAKDLDDLKKELKGHWKHIRQHTEGPKKKKRTATKKTSRKKSARKRK